MISISIKPGVKLAGIRAEIVLAVIIAAGVYHEIANKELVVTEVTGGKHGIGSLHYVGQAVDIRTRDLTEEQKQKIVAELKRRLGENYDVVLESDHIHIEFQPK